MVFNLNNIILVCCIVWLIILTVQMIKVKSHYNKLTGNTKKQTLTEILDEWLQRQKKSDKELTEINKQVSLIKSEARFHIQKIGIVRYNPFSDTGGSQSFTVALMDNEENGIVMTSLYARTGNRWYIKHVREGKGIELELSKEEHAAMQKAKNISQ